MGNCFRVGTLLTHHGNREDLSDTHRHVSTNSHAPSYFGCTFDINPFDITISKNTHADIHVYFSYVNSPAGTLIVHDGVERLHED